MNSGSVVFWSGIGIGILAIFLSMLIYLIPSIEKGKFDNICDQYFTVLVANGNLSISDQNDLKNKLESRNYKNISINVTNGDWGDEVVLTVTAVIELKQVYGKIESYPTKYENRSISLGFR